MKRKINLKRRKDKKKKMTIMMTKMNKRIISKKMTETITWIINSLKE